MLLIHNSEARRWGMMMDGDRREKAEKDLNAGITATLSLPAGRSPAVIA